MENTFEEIMTENFPNLKREADIHVQKAQRASKKMNPNRHTPRHIIKVLKIETAFYRENKRVRGEVSKGRKRKAKSQLQRNPINLSTDCSTETLQARRE